MRSDLARDQAISRLEQTLATNPGDKQAARALFSILDYYMPARHDLGAYTNAQRCIASRYRHADWPGQLLDPAVAVGHYKQWEATLAALRVTPQIPINQLFTGTFVKIHGRQAYCDLHLALFEQKGVISRICHDCYKVQILPVDLVALVQTYFIFLRLRFPRDNARKCMIELREGSRNPYKGYIYCESEEEAVACLAAFEDQATAVSCQVLCGLSHGCSEYGEMYPGFKFSLDGAHRSFARPDDWDASEADFFATTRISPPDKADNNKSIITLRDVLAIRTWIKYAEMIGDTAFRLFSDPPIADLPEAFMVRVGRQAKTRSAELRELRARLS